MVLLVLAACTGDGPGKPSGDDSGTPFSWVPPEEVTVEEVGGMHGPEVSDLIFDDVDLAAFSIELPDESWDILEKERKGEEHEWVEGAFIYEGVRYDPVGVRLKGENSFLNLNQKPSLKIKFDKYVDGMEFAGMEELTLNNMSNDYSMMHERVSYRLMREAGIPASRCSHSTLSLNGEDYGLYAVLETVDKTMMKRWMDDADGIMFEVWDVDFYDYYVPYFQLEYGEEDRSHLQGVADALEAEGAAAITDAGQYMDMDQFVRFYAVESVIGQYDSYPFSSPGDDAHVFVDPSIDKLIWLPHGMDETFYYPDNNPKSVNGIVAKRCLAVGACEKAYNAAVWEVQGISEEIDLHGYAQEVQEQIADLVKADDHKQYSNSEVSYYQDAMIDFIGGRANKLPKWVGERPE